MYDFTYTIEVFGTFQRIVYEFSYTLSRLEEALPIVYGFSYTFGVFGAFQRIVYEFSYTLSRLEEAPPIMYDSSYTYGLYIHRAAELRTEFCAGLRLSYDGTSDQ
ncbi:hypothetical protein [Paenibacillus sp. GXUN7292]|uniref:hypothetical protein n=1 Tax=Paenibacillus sp. GXUN7292 TaxID=3422499 RepID=UPI003D7E8FC6